MSEKKLHTGYEFSRAWFDFCFENPDKINPSHTAIYFFAIEHCNRMGWKEKFGFPTQMTMDALGIKKHQTYIKYFNDLCEWGFIKLIQRSVNQYSANIISIQIGSLKNGKALDKAFITHAAKQTEPSGQSTGQSKDSIDKQQTINNITTNKEPELVGDFLVPNMCLSWYKKFPHYSKNKDADFPAMLKILQFMSTQSGQTNINDPTVKETILKKLEQVADEVLKDQFWINKSINSIANNIQEFYNKIKNPKINGNNNQRSFPAAGNRSLVTENGDFGKL